MKIIDGDKLKQHYAWWANGDRSARDSKRIFDAIIDLQPTLSLKAAPVWIKFPDHKPDTPKEISFIGNDGETVRADEYIVVIHGADEATTLLWDGEGWRDYEGARYAVTHWMRMPEVPSETS